MFRVHPAREPPHLLRVLGRHGVGSRLAGDVVGGKGFTLRHQLRVVLADEMPVRVVFVPDLQGWGRLC